MIILGSRKWNFLIEQVEAIGEYQERQRLWENVSVYKKKQKTISWVKDRVGNKISKSLST